MDRNNIVIMLVISSVLAIYFIGSSISGFVISESCCTGAKCSIENLCPQASSLNEKPGLIGTGPATILSLLFLLIDILLVYHLYDKKTI